jgi:hypothetical protein
MLRVWHRPTQYGFKWLSYKQSPTQYKARFICVVKLFKHTTMGHFSYFSQAIE